MLSKKIISIICILFITISLIFTGCSKVDEENIESEALADNPEVKVIELKEKYPPDIAYFEWDVVTEKEYIERSVLIFKGTIIDKKEYVIEKIKSKEYTFKDYRTVFSVKISEIYYCEDKDIKVGDTVKVMSPISSYTWEPEAVQMEKGQEFILFASLFEEGVSADYINLAKYYIGNPWEPIISVKEDSFEIDPVFESLAKNASIEERKISENYSIEILVRSDEKFISDLKELVNKYKNIPT